MKHPQCPPGGTTNVLAPATRCHKRAALQLLLAGSYRVQLYGEVAEGSAGQVPDGEVASGSKSGLR
jgi:hypothetical protein